MSYKKVKKIVLRIILAITSLVILAYLIISAPYWWRHWVTYPTLEKARADLWTQHQATQNYSGKENYKGVLHAHSYWSHDSRGVLSEILPAAKQAKLDFIFFSDHIRSKQDSFPRGYHGVYEGIILESGTETSQLMISPLKEVVLDWEKGKEQVIKEVVDSGGFVGYVHSEEEHAWDNPHYQAMEIYNIHTDLIDEEESFLLKLVVNSFINGAKYRHWAYRELFDVQHDILRHWDELNQKRQIVGFAAVDAHNNQNFRARYTEEGLVEWVGPNAKTMSVEPPGWKEKWLLGEPDSAGWAFKWEVDTYFASFNFVNTHVFCDTFSSKNIIKNLVEGHAFIAFENLAEAEGFQFFVRDQQGTVQAIMGDSIKLDQAHQLIALSPFPVKFTLIRNGEIIDEEQAAYSYEYNLIGKEGNYRIEASLLLKDQWVPWVYTNPIYLY